MPRGLMPMVTCGQRTEANASRTRLSARARTRLLVSGRPAIGGMASAGPSKYQPKMAHVSHERGRSMRRQTPMLSVMLSGTPTVGVPSCTAPALEVGARADPGALAAPGLVALSVAAGGPFNVPQARAPPDCTSPPEDRISFGTSPPASRDDRWSSLRTVDRALVGSAQGDGDSRSSMNRKPPNSRDVSDTLVLASCFTRRQAFIVATLGLRHSRYGATRKERTTFQVPSERLRKYRTSSSVPFASCTSVLLDPLSPRSAAW